LYSVLQPFKTDTVDKNKRSSRYAWSLMPPLVPTPG